jgi:DNA-binding XRE family transcriptional regulator
MVAIEAGEYEPSLPLAFKIANLFARLTDTKIVVHRTES